MTVSPKKKEERTKFLLEQLEIEGFRGEGHMGGKEGRNIKYNLLRFCLVKLNYKLSDS
jgi:hypothetical protein